MNVFLMQNSIVRPLGRDMQNVLIGFVGEHEARTFFVRTRDDLTGYTVGLVIDDVDCGAMIKAPMPDGSTMLSLTLTSDMLGRGGDKVCQLLMTKDSIVRKSSQFRAYVGASNDINSTAPDSATIIIISEKITELVHEAALEAIGEVQEVIDSIPQDYSALSGDVTQLKADLEDLDERVEALEEGGSGLTEDVKTALMNLVNHLAWDDDDPTGQSYIDALEDALYPPADLVVVNTLVNCSTSNNSASVTRGGAYSATITPSSGCSLYDADIVITMGGVDITNTAYSNGTISIATVTGNLSIIVTCYTTIQWDKSKGRVPSSSDGITTTNTGIENSDMTEAFDSDKGIVVTGTGEHLLRYDVADYQYIKKGTFEITFTVDSMANDSNINLRLTKDGTNGSNMAVMRTAAKGYHIRYTKATNTSVDWVANSFNLNQEYTLKVDFDYNTNGKIMVYLDGTKVYETTTQSSYYANRNALIFTYTLKVYVKSFRWVIKEGILNE